jgi:uncharacterized protein YgfB (UPF0149 family)
MKYQTPYLLVEEIAPYSDAHSSAAEIHGVMTGMLCVDDGFSCQQWLGNAFGDGEDELHEGQLGVLHELWDETQDLLNAEDYGFDMFLPDEDDGLIQRGEALGEWCQGFLLGIGFGIGDAKWPEECTEVLKDIMQISQLDAEGGSDDDLSELIEYVRIAVQSVKAEFLHHARKLRLH